MLSAIVPSIWINSNINARYFVYTCKNRFTGLQKLFPKQVHRFPLSVGSHLKCMMNCDNTAVLRVRNGIYRSHLSIWWLEGCACSSAEAIIWWSLRTWVELPRVTKSQEIQSIMCISSAKGSDQLRILIDFTATYYTTIVKDLPTKANIEWLPYPLPSRDIPMYF